ncbi:MAG: alcohol dehydrogenase catalytic domain-containing protein [Desulfuromonadales bacterium]|nr:alcohol dehydrogenase catalytic domain-containing protein [Desulfuromonadales bacterium]
MKAAVFQEVGKPLGIETVTDPQPQAGEVIIQVKACGICGTDLHATVDPTMLVPAGTVLGHEFSGEIVEIGPGVPGDWKKGDRLCTLPFIGCGDCVPCRTGEPWQCPGKGIIGFDVPGGFAEYARVHANEAIRLPETVSWQEGALVEPLAVSLHAVRLAGKVEGKRVLVIGAGAIGLGVANWCNFFGARDVIVSERDPNRARQAQKFGATGFVDARGEAAAEFQRLTGGAPELIFECVGVPGLLARCVEMAAYGAEIVVVGFCMQPDTFVPALAMLKEISFKFSIGNNKAEFQFIADMMAADRINMRPLITDLVSLSDLPTAFEALRRPVHQCKVLWEPK